MEGCKTIHSKSGFGGLHVQVAANFTRGSKLIINYRALTVVHQGNPIWKRCKDACYLTYGCK